MSLNATSHVKIPGITPTWNSRKMLWYRCYYPHWLRGSVSPVCRILNDACQHCIYWHHMYMLGCVNQHNLFKTYKFLCLNVLCCYCQYIPLPPHWKIFKLTIKSFTNITRRGPVDNKPSTD